MPEEREYMSAGALGIERGLKGGSDNRDNRATSCNSDKQLEVWRRGILDKEREKAASQGSVN